MAAQRPCRSPGLIQEWSNRSGESIEPRGGVSPGPLERPRSVEGDVYHEGMARRILLAWPRGYCAGVERAVDTVERALRIYGAPVYVRKQIVHNLHVVRDLEAQGRRVRRGRDARCPRARWSSSPPTASRPRSTTTSARRASSR